MKKKIIKITSSLALIGLAFGCGDEFLDQKPYGSVSLTTLSANAKGADALLIAAYSELDGYGGWNGNPWGAAVSNWTYGSIAGGDAYKGSEANDQPDVTPIERHETTPLNPYIEAKWRLVYDGVSRANKAINAFNGLTGFDATLLKQKLGEARFLRGYYHFEAKRFWNNIPYIDENNTDFKGGNTADVWPQIMADLQYAADNLPESQSDIGRVNKYAANAMLGKAFMYQKKYAEAKAAFDKVIASGKYKLMDKYGDLFDPAFRNNSESVFVVQQSVNDGTAGDNGNVGEVLNFPYSGGPGGCCGFNQPSQNLVNAFKVDAKGLPLYDTYNASDLKNDQGIPADKPYTPDVTTAVDPRLDWTVGRRGIPYLDWGLHPGVTWIRDQGYAGPYSPKKAMYYKSESNQNSSASGWTAGYTNNNYPIIRYADVLLLAAEAEIELGNLEKARGYVNQIRTRASNKAGFVVKYKDDTDPTKGYTTTPAANYQIGLYTTAWTDAATARKAVRFERRVELGQEGDRFFDLVRWGVAAAEKNAYFAVESKKRTYLAGATFKAGTSEYYPIPTAAITLSSKDGKPTLTQNPGY